LFCGFLSGGNALGFVSGLLGIVTSSSAGAPNCAVVSGAAVCWGENFGDKRGYGSATPSWSPTVVAGLDHNVSSISNGPESVCAVVSGAAKCWGSNFGGLLGVSGIDGSNVPVDVPSLGSGVTAVSVGEWSACAIVSGGVRCWSGRKQGGVVDPPAPIEGLSSGVTAIAVGPRHACAIASGKLKCWGLNLSGQLGNGGIRPATQQTPVTVSAPGPSLTIRHPKKNFTAPSVKYDDTGVNVTVSFGPPKHVLVKDACTGRVAISLLKEGAKPQAHRIRIGSGSGVCEAHWQFPVPSGNPDKVTVRVSSKGNKVIKPFNIKKVAPFETCECHGA
jgi:hypothetical protein